MERVCLKCGGIFVVRGGVRTLCDNCYFEANKKVCAVCGEVFIGNSVACSMACGRVSAKNKLVGVKRDPKLIARQRETIKNTIANKSPEELEQWNANKRKAIRSFYVENPDFAKRRWENTSEEQKERFSARCKEVGGLGTEVNERRRETVKKHYANLTSEQRKVFVDAGIKGSQASTNRFRTYGKSSYEQELAGWLKASSIPYEQNNRSVLNGKELDFYFPYAAFAIEFNGGWYHSVEGIMKLDARFDCEYAAKAKHLEKSKLCAARGITLFHIWEWEWINPELQLEIKRKIILILSGLQDVEFCEPKEVGVIKVGGLSYENTSMYVAPIAT